MDYPPTCVEGLITIPFASHEANEPDISHEVSLQMESTL